MRYIVVHVSLEEMDPCLDESTQESSPDVRNLIICGGLKEVGEAISSRGDCDWAVFEVVEKPTGKKVGAFDVMKQTAERRAVVFEKDGKTVKRVE